MDLYAEGQCIENMKGGDSKQFLLLFDANFAEAYKYVARRVTQREEIEKITRLTFLDGLGQIQSTPQDVAYLIWLYSLAKPRVWDYIAASSMPEKQGLITVLADEKDEKRGEEVIEKVNKMMKKLSLEEREILRLKFFEQVADGDLITILGIEEGKVGPKIYRVLKRAHFLLFGESDKKQGVYFGELSGLFDRVKQMEQIEVPEVLKLSLKADISSRIDRKETAINGEAVDPGESADSGTASVPPEGPFKVKGDVGGDASVEESKHVGSDDPAKIFVEAVKEMREEEEEKLQKEKEKFERMERRHNFIDKWKGVLGLVPMVLFVWIVIFVIMNLGGFLGGIERGYPTLCDVDVAFDGDFYDGEKRSVIGGVSNPLCENFVVERLEIVRIEDGIVEVEVDLLDWFLEYRFEKESNEWRVKKYARTLSSNQESGEIS
jgi:DNA-directed RNA polymerase specialized sigma24 family protein